MSDYFEFYAPVKIVAGEAALEHLPYELSSRGVTRPLVITDAGVRGAGIVDVVTGAADGMDVAGVYDAVPSDSSTRVVTEIARMYRAQRADAILAIGGGSVMDTAKGVNILVSLGGDSPHDYLGAGSITRRLNPLVAVPTTSGTGSEVTVAAVIRDDETGVKLPFASPFLLPDVAILDPRTTAKLPAFLTAATALDALTHAVESYTGLAQNPVSDGYATAAIERIAQNVVKVLDDPSDMRARLELAVAATMAGIAFSNSMVGLVHSLGHSVGAVSHVHHGVCMGILLPRVLEYNLDAVGDRVARLLLHLAGPERFANTPESQRAIEAIAEIDRLRETLHALAKVPRSLQEAGCKTKAELDEAAALAVNDGTLLYNPVEASLEEARGVLERAW